MQELFLKVHGRVQGVFFRHNTNELAQKLKLAGWVKNVSDGTVEILAQGDSEKLKKLEEWARKGSMLAKVEKVEADYREVGDRFDDFNIVYN